MHTLRRAVRDRAFVVLGVAGPSGSGKTYSALLLAEGLAGGKDFAVVDTEARRATHYVPPFDFLHMDLTPPFTPDNYLQGIKACEKHGVDVIVIDSMSHEWNGEGGLSAWHDEIVHARVERAMKQDSKANEAQLIEAYNVFGWREPKAAHKKMMAHLVQVRAHLIFCFRAEERVRFVQVVKGGKKRTVVESAGWQPICEKSMPYELTASFMLSPDAPGVPKPLKLQAQHAAMFDLAKPITAASGAQLAAWSIGAAVPAVPLRATVPPSVPTPITASKATPEPAAAPSAAPPSAPLRGVPQLPPVGGPDAPTYQVIDVMAMLSRMHGGGTSMTKTEMGNALEAAFAPGVKSRAALEMYTRSSPDHYRSCFAELHRRFVAWKDEHA